jgi:hypothetical protein
MPPLILSDILAWVGLAAVAGLAMYIAAKAVWHK